jgi:MoxR-like ATPase
VTNNQIGDRFNLNNLQTIANPEQVLAMQAVTANIAVDQAVIDYAVRITRATRQWQGIRVGAGPRGSIALVRAARATALLAGRDFVHPDDIKAISLPVLRHRISLAPEMELEGFNTDQILSAILEKTEAPRK